MQVNKSRKLWVYWNAAWIVALAVQISISGCLTPEQQAALGKLDHKRSQIQAAIDSLDEEITLVRNAFREGKITKELKEQLVAGYEEKKGKLKASFKGVDKAIAEAKAANVPWWAYIPTILAGIAGVGGSVLGVRKVGAAGRTASSALSAFGAVARAIDTAGGGEAAPEVRALISTEIKSTPGLTTETVRGLHASATDGNI